MDPAPKADYRNLGYLGVGLIAGFVAGLVTAGGLSLHKDAEKYDFGHYVGTIDGKIEVFRAIEKHFGKHDRKTPYQPVFQVKDCDIVSVETSGVRTVRVLP